MKICINQGHSTVDCGAVGQTGLTESEVNVRIGELVMYHLQQCGNFDVLLVHDDELQGICDESNQFCAELFVSIHCNAASNDQAKGTETFYGSDERLSQCIQSQIINSMGTIDRGIKDGNHLYVIKHTDCKAILVECAFISNSEDECMLANENSRNEFARAIARGITDYISGN